MSYIFLFPGQGAQYPGMGQDLYDNFSSVQDLFHLASDLACMDLVDILFNGTEEQLKQTKITQIGITLINLSIATVLSENSVMAEATAGFSLGEYSALWYAGVLSTEEVFRAVIERGRVMEECCRQLQLPKPKEKDKEKTKEISGEFSGDLEVRPSMAAVIGLNYEEVATALKSLQDAGEQVYIANYNATKQIVIAGESAGIMAAESIMEAAGAMKYVPLKVSGPFHTPLMQRAADNFRPFLSNELHFAKPRLALYSNVSGQKVDIDKTKEDDLLELALRQIYSPVLWLDIEEALKKDGYGQALEIGPGNVLSGLWKQFRRKEPCQPLGTLNQINEFLKSVPGV